MANTILSPTPFQPFGDMGPNIWLGVGGSGYAPPASSQDGTFGIGDWWIPYPPIAGSAAMFICVSASPSPGWQAVSI
jgi:hypothetical protein